MSKVIEDNSLLRKQVNDLASQLMQATQQLAYTQQPPGIPTSSVDDYLSFVRHKLVNIYTHIQ